MALMNDYTAPYRGDPDSLGDDKDYTAAVASGDLNKLFEVLERENGLPRGYLARTAQIESGGNPNAKNPRSSAGGLFQQLDSNARQYGVMDKFDPVQSALGAAAFAADNAATLGAKLGRDPTAAELYMGHQQGPAGAAKILASPDAPLASLVGGSAASLNGGAGMTAGQFANRFAQKFGGGTPTMTADASTVSGSSGSDTMTGSGGSDRFQGGLASKPYVPADEGSGIGDIISAIGLSMMSGQRGNLLGNMPKILATQEAERARREDRRYGMYKDQRNFDVGRQDAAQAQSNTEASRALQVRGLDTADKNTTFNQGLQTKADARAEAAAAKGQVNTLADGSTVRINDDNTVTQLTPPIKSAESTDLIKNFTQAKKDGFTGNFIDYQRAIKGGADLSVSDRKAILSADEAVESGKGVLGNLREAMDLSKKAYEGPSAGLRGTITGAFGSEAGLATQNYDNVVTNNALSSLKTVFGGNPTEGERKILLDVAGSSSKPDAVRQEILKRAYAAAERRIAVMQERADEMRGGTYYKAGSGQVRGTEPARAPSTPIKVSTPDEARKLPKGTPIILPDGSQGVVP